MDEEQIQELERLQNERRNLKDRIMVVKLDLRIEREKASFLQSMLKREQEMAQHLAQRENLFTEVPKTLKESDKILKKVHSALMLPGFRDEIYAAVEEVLRYRQKVVDERVRKHQKAMKDANDDLLRDPEFVATIGRQKTLAELEKELEEIDLQSAAEQAETDKIAEEQQQVVESYEANILELQTEIDAEEAEIAQIEAEDALASAVVAGASEEQPMDESTVSAVAEQPVAAEVPLQFRRFEVFESVDDLVLPPDDDSSDESMSTADRLLAIANAIAQKPSNSSPVEARDEGILHQVPQPTAQDDHNYAQPQRANETNVAEATSAQPPLFVAPLAPAPHKRKENAPENVLPVKRAHFDRPLRSPVESRETSREPPRQSPRESPTKPPRRSPGEFQRRSPAELSHRSPERETGFTRTNRLDRIEPDLSLVKSEFPTEQKMAIAQPAQESLGATPGQVVSQLQHRSTERARYSNPSSAFQPIDFSTRYSRDTDNRSIGLLGSSGQSASKAPAMLPSTQVSAAPTDGNGGILRIHTHSRNVQATTSRPAPRDDARATSQSTGHRAQVTFAGFDDDVESFSGTAFHSQQSMFSTAQEAAGNPVTAPAVDGSTQNRADRGNETSRNRNEQPDSSRPDQRGAGDDRSDNEFTFGDGSFSDFDFNPNVSNNRSGETDSFDRSFGDFSFTSRAGSNAGGAGGAGRTNEFDWENNSDDFGGFGDFGDV